jgi:hypothetical protein
MDTTGSGTPSDLRLQPQMIPQLLQGYQDALDQLRPALADAGDGYRIDQPAMGDQASAEFRHALNQHTCDGPGSVREQLTAFEQRLRETVDKLGAIQRAYDRNETDTAAALSRQLEP